MTNALTRCDISTNPRPPHGSLFCIADDSLFIPPTNLPAAKQPEPAATPAPAIGYKQNCVELAEKKDLQSPTFSANIAGIAQITTAPRRIIRNSTTILTPGWKAVATMIMHHRQAASQERPWLTDFATIFAHMWYRDFPLQRSLREAAQRSDWTTHIGITVRSTADLMGLFTCFESGGRTDALLRDAKGVVAALEWEWDPLHKAVLEKGTFNEFEKLQTLCSDSQYNCLKFVALVVYGRTNGDHYSSQTDQVLELFEKQWPKTAPPLLLLVVLFEYIDKRKGFQRRQFHTLEMYELAGGKEKRLLRRQPALPWKVSGSRWSTSS